MSEEELLSQITSIQEDINKITVAFNEASKPLRDMLQEKYEAYAEFSPLKVGDEFSYSPDERTTAAIVRVLKSMCVGVPDKWMYFIEVCGSCHESDLGKKTWITLHGWKTPLILNRNATQ